jgi:hypothetical protein
MPKWKEAAAEVNNKVIGTVNLFSTFFQTRQRTSELQYWQQTKNPQ